MIAKIWNFSGWISLTNEGVINDYFDGLLIKAGFAVLNKSDFEFEPQGYTALWLLAESHFAVHTFPEHKTAYVELSSCNEEKQIQFLKLLKADYEIREQKEITTADTKF